MPMRHIRWLIRVLIKYGKLLVLEKVAERSLSIFQTVLKMKIIDIPDLVRVMDLPLDVPFKSLDFHFIDRDFSQETICKNLKAPQFGRYKLVSFPGGIRMTEMLLIALTRGFRLANVSEVLSVQQFANLDKLGLGENYSLVALGTVIKRSSALFAVCCPVLTFYTTEREGRQVREKVLNLHDLFESCPPSYHILFRVK